MSTATPTATPAGGPAPLRGNRDFRALMIGNGVNDLGTAIGVVTLTIVVFQFSHNAALVGLVDTVDLATMVLCGIPAGWFADRFRKKRVMTCAAAFGAVAYAALFAVVHSGHIHVPLLLPPVILAAIGSALYNASSRASLRSIVQSSEIAEATTIIQARGALTAIIGAPVGGLLCEMHAWLPLAVNAVSYLVPMCAVFMIGRDLAPSPVAAADAAAGEPGGDGDVDGPASERLSLASVFAGARLLFGDRALRGSTIIGVLTGFASTGYIMSLIVVLQQRHYSFTIVGALQSACAVGMVFGAVFAPAILKSFKLGSFSVVALLLVAGCFAAVTEVHQSWLILGLLGLGCVLVIPLTSGFAAYEVKVVPPGLQGRVSSADKACTDASGAFAPILAGALLSAYGGRSALLVFAALLAVAAGYCVLDGAIRSLDVREVATDESDGPGADGPAAEPAESPERAVVVVAVAAEPDALAATESRSSV